MKDYIEIAEDSNGAILKKAREDYAKSNNIKFGQKELAQYLGLSPSFVGLLEQGRREIPQELFKKINTLLGTNFSKNSIVNNKYSNTCYSPLYFYFGMYNFTQKQYDYIIATLLIKYCKEILDEDENDKYSTLIYSCKSNKLFDTSVKKRMNECFKYIIRYLNSLYHKHKSSYISEISGKALTKTQCRQELYNLLTTLDSSKVVDSTHLKIPVYNSSGIIEYYEDLPSKFNNDNYKYFYLKFDNMDKKFSSKYEDGIIALIRKEEFCFYNEDVLIQCGNDFAIRHIKSQEDLKNAFIECFGTDAIVENGYNIIGAIVMIDYSTCAIINEESKIQF